MSAAHDERELRVRVRQVRWEAERVVSLDLERLDGTDLPEWTPGAHLDLHLPGGLTRQYSLTGSPADRRHWRIAVLHDATGRGGSRAVHTQVRPGDELIVVGPRNNFALEDAADYLFIAGGIGITPLLPMISAVAASDAAWRLVYGGRTRAAMAFATALLEAHPGRVDVVPQDERGLLDLPALLDDLDPRTQVYCCGPEALLTAVEARCAPGRLRVERFAARPRAENPATAERPFDVVLQQSGDVVAVAPGQSVLDALETRGIDVPNSCREGICGTCETKVIAGLPDHRDSLLSDEERAANDTMMVCVGRALSDRLVLDL